MRILLIFVLCLQLPLLFFSSSTLASTAPVRQDLGQFDAVFNDLSELQCRTCHGASASELHHALASSQQMACLDCHALVAADGTFKLLFTTDCLECHQQQPGTASVHHLATSAQDGDCAACHDGMVQNPNDSHYIPSYAASMVTPLPSDGTGLEGRGSCQYCHDWGTDMASGNLVFSNMQTHHETGFGQQAEKCAWCHNELSGTSLAIRACEQCHAPLSIHNIQADTNGDGIVTPGGELPFFGHIGSNEDCLGCHGGVAALPAGPKSALGNPTRHHLLVQTKGKKCLDCHALVLNDEGLFVFKDFRTCSSCHGAHRR